MWCIAWVGAGAGGQGVILNIDINMGINQNPVGISNVCVSDVPKHEQLGVSVSPQILVWEFVYFEKCVCVQKCCTKSFKCISVSIYFHQGHL